MKKQWWKEAVVYQIYPRSFMDSNGDGVGDIQGIVSRLDYLKELGIDVVWLSPVYKSPNDDNGYDISDYRDIMNEFGTMQDWEMMLEEMHKRGIRLVMDLVVNHSSDEHAWFMESEKSKDNPYRDYYIWRPGKDGKEPNNWESFFSGSAWQYNEETDDYYLHLFSKKQPDLNWENEKVRKEVYDLMKFWLDKGVDGFRMDVINLISKDPSLPDGPVVEGKDYASGADYYMNGPKIHEYLQEMNKEMLSHYDVMSVGETPGVTPNEGILYTGEDRHELDMIFQFEHMDVDSGPSGKWDVKPLDLVKLKKILSKWQTELHGKGWNSLYWNNHDQPRIVSRFGDDGTYRIESAKMLGTCLHFLQGTPYIYQGEEIGMTNVQFPDIEYYRDIESINMYNEKIEKGMEPEQIMKGIFAKGRDNARTPMQWDNSEQAGFSTGKPWINVNPNYVDINAKNALKDSDSIFYYYKKLIALRKEMRIIVEGSFELIEAEHEYVFAYMRHLDNQTLLVLTNFTGGEQSVAWPDSVKDYHGRKIISNYSDRIMQETAAETILRPWEAIVYLIER
ncbi:glycoside hydrolase family 13 protein [Bacillus sp. FJAT-27986]|uniref:glycoside hydrolase family 13 protein n=1 Tax=Bacillus sp. FJAT-27986 TaxID=1743146 RepID=UPI00080AFCAB|nr:alpha-glucosidase [Bacillus sp. FJAT-27986]OCA88621.1 glucohydrolase [Bacillus sp. FJAT-27986]